LVIARALPKLSSMATPYNECVAPASSTVAKALRFIVPPTYTWFWSSTAIPLAESMIPLFSVVGQFESSGFIPRESPI
jgi:hypothetical protein